MDTVTQQYKYIGEPNFWSHDTARITIVLWLGLALLTLIATIIELFNKESGESIRERAWAALTISWRVNFFTALTYISSYVIFGISAIIAIVYNLYCLIP